MKKQRSITIIILMITLLFTFTGCTKNNDVESPQAVVAETSAEVSETLTEVTEAQTEVAEEESEAFTVEDMAGNSITFDQVPSKIAVLLASDVEILYELGASDSIVAVGEYCDYPSEALEKDVITTGDDLNIEQIVAIQPEAVIMATMAQSTEQIEQLENAGIKVIITDSQNIADTYVAIELLGKVSGKNEEALTLIENMKAEFAALKEKATENAEKTIYFEVSPLEYGLWTTGQNTFMQELADIVGVKNVFDDVTGWAEISEEQVLERNPDYIVTVSMYSKDGQTPTEEILARKNWEEIRAVKDGNVLSDESDMFTRPGPRLVDAAKALYEFIQ